MGVRGASENEPFFDRVRVPASNVVTLGDPEYSPGFVAALNIYNSMRVVRGAFDLAHDDMTAREQFGQKLYEMQSR